MTVNFSQLNPYAGNTRKIVRKTSIGTTYE